MASSSPPSTNRATRSLAGTVAIVTGAGSAGQGIGNGRASALLLAEAGASVLCIDMNLEDAKNTVSMIDSETPSPQPFTTSSSSSTSDKRRAVALQADVTDEQQCKHAIDAALDLWGRLDILVNNVGIGGARGTAETVDKDDWAKGLEVNVTSMMLMAKFAVPAMRKNRIWSDDDDDGVTGDELSNTRMWRGSIVNMGSVAGIRGGTPHLLYPTAKGAVVNMTRAMAAHHAPDGIRVNCVCPGMLYTPMMYGPGMTEDAREARKNRSLLKTEGSGWDAAAAVRFLASDEARWITGLIMPVDAGSTAAVGSELPKSASVGAQ